MIPLLGLITNMSSSFPLVISKRSDEILRPSTWITNVELDASSKTSAEYSPSRNLINYIKHFFLNLDFITHLG